ncbi:extensin family protein [Luteibacter yeojuensis]|uniref:Extensin-like C-terminal domain-containing protein n=1 Tax=Luteibacter yeojuensis TaxID=345309 RepID=A0A0F3KYT1_9GAMM|nr:extensin family protein [Luteibacter yeojuensis]KJV36092.1 hypothetical protein VI08_06350 [Luteibacter yeojuensis]
MRPLLIVLAIITLVAAAWLGGWRPPDRYNPWAPLDLAAAPDMFLRFKLSRLGDDPAVCHAALEGARVAFTPVADREEASGCGWHDALRVSALNGARLASPVMLTCPLAASLAMWERNVLQPHAEAAFGSPVRTIDHVGSYACRNIYHRDEAPLSRHARADALDITGFRLANGRRISVEKDWSDEAGFLRGVQADGCHYFGALFGPDYNAAHRTHFHAQGSGFGYCR